MHTCYEHYSLLAPVADNFESSDTKNSKADESYVDFIPAYISQSYYAEYGEPAFVLKDKKDSN